MMRYILSYCLNLVFHGVHLVLSVSGVCFFHCLYWFLRPSFEAMLHETRHTWHGTLNAEESDVPKRFWPDLETEIEAKMTVDSDRMPHMSTKRFQTEVRR